MEFLGDSLQKLSKFSEIVTKIKRDILINGNTNESDEKVRYLEKIFTMYENKFNTKNKNESNIFSNFSFSPNNEESKGQNKNAWDGEIDSDISSCSSFTVSTLSMQEKNDNDNMSNCSELSEHHIGELYDSDNESCHIDEDCNKKMQDIDKDMDLILEKIINSKYYSVKKKNQYIFCKEKTI
jgi:hypothetical protein